MKLPTRKTMSSAGADLASSENYIIEPNQTVLISTGFKLTDIWHRVHQGLFFMLCLRSSVALRQGLILANGVGIIDVDYTDEIRLIVTNLSGVNQEIKKGDRIGQLVACEFYPYAFDCEDKTRTGGFGSTGV